MLLAHLSDLHFGGGDDIALEAVRFCLEQRRPDAIVVTGDISRSGLVGELDEAFGWIRSLPAPALVVPGNHDVPYYSLFGRICDPFGPFDRAAEGVRLAHWHAPSWSITPINTARGVQPRLNWAQGAVSRKQVENAIVEVRSAAPQALSIVATHHPLQWPASAPIRGRTWGGRAAQRALIDAGARVFLGGHLHASRVEHLEGGRAISVSAGTLSRRLRDEPCGFAFLSQEIPSEVEVEFLYIKHGRAETSTVQTFRLDGLWS